MSARLFYLWLHDPDLALGIFVPLFALFVVYRERHKLQAFQPRASWKGLLVALLGLLPLSIGSVRSELFLSGVSFLIVVAGSIILFEGWAFFRAVFFPWAFLLLMFPNPVLDNVRFTLFLESLSGWLASILFHISGISVPMEGNQTPLLPGMQVFVCVGGGLLMLLTVTMMYGYFADERGWGRTLLALLVIPIEVVRGSSVIILAALFAEFTSPATTLAFLHTYNGCGSFLAAVLTLIALHSAIAAISKKKPDTPPPVLTQLMPTTRPVGKR
jgi:exosortase